VENLTGSTKLKSRHIQGNWALNKFERNATVESELHQLKHDLQRVLTEEGIQIDLSDEQYEKA
jgi:hypothetical protein